MVGLVAVVVALTVATAFGVWWRRRSGLLRVAQVDERVGAEVLGSSLGDRATLVQFSSAFCRPCVATRHVLGAVAGSVPGVVHVEVDAESHLDLVRRLGVMSTPTTLLLDRAGRVRRRATGVPRREAVLAALADVLE
ncbi:MAG: thioredoxin family protein [Frankiaceae bacterium]|nr:thioredoxin family protein [Frankiaceae bacterium]